MRTFGAHKGTVGITASLRQLVFGIEDGIVSTTGAVIGIAAGSQDARIVILSGVVIIIVEALSMAAGEYLSSKSHRELLEEKIREEEREIEEHPEKEREELHAMYRERGFNDEERDILVRRITADKKLWLEEMMAKELRIGAGELDETPHGALVMWTAYTVGGALPVLPFLFLSIPAAIASSFILALASLFALGFWKARVAGIDPIRSGLEMLVVGAGAGVAGYLVGRAIGALFGITVA